MAAGVAWGGADGDSVVPVLCGGCGGFGGGGFGRGGGAGGRSLTPSLFGTTLGGGLGGGGPFAAGGTGGFALFARLGGGIGVFVGGAPFAGGRGGGGTGADGAVNGFGGGGGGFGASESVSGFTGVDSLDTTTVSVSDLEFSSLSPLGPNFGFFVGEATSLSSESTRDGDLRTRDIGLAKTASPSPSE